MADKSNDVLIKVVNKGVAFAAENRTEFARTMDSLRVGFSVGYFFELKTFDYSVGSVSALVEKKGEGATDPVKGLSAGKKKTDFVDIQPVGFSRLVDMASMTLFTALIASQTLDSVTIVKRKAAGTRNGGEIYLRLDFNKVLLTELKWKEDEEFIVETGSFIYRELDIQYRPQKADGLLGAVIPSSWRTPS